MKIEHIRSYRLLATQLKLLIHLLMMTNIHLSIHRLIVRKDHNKQLFIVIIQDDNKSDDFYIVPLLNYLSKRKNKYYC